MVPRLSEFKRLPAEIIIMIMKILKSNAILNMIKACEWCAEVFSTSEKLLTNFILDVNQENIENLREIGRFPFQNISITFDQNVNVKSLLKFVKKFQYSVVNLELRNLKLKNNDVLTKFFKNFVKMKSVKFINCKVENENNTTLLYGMLKLEALYFEECSGSFFKLFKNNHSVKKVTIKSNNSVWNGFCHNSFNELAKTLKNFTHLVLIGEGTEGYFDGDDFPYKIEKLEVSSITYRWYVGIKTARKTFLESQKGYLKELTIHKLPYDFDGGKVIKFIIDHMGLEKFYYGSIPLILNGHKQKVLKFEATEVQISSVYEMFFQFPSIKSFILRLSNEDIASDEIERIIDASTDLFRNLEEFELIDESGIRGLFGVFLGLYKNLNNINKLVFRTQDRNINVILEECLPKMKFLTELHLENNTPRQEERIKIVNAYAQNLIKFEITHNGYILYAKDHEFNSNGAK